MISFLSAASVLWTSGNWTETVHAICCEINGSGVEKFLENFEDDRSIRNKTEVIKVSRIRAGFLQYWGF